MTDRKLVYRIEVNTSQAKSEAKQFASQIKTELSNIKINVLDGRAFAGADKHVEKLRANLQSLNQIQPPKLTVDDAPFARITERAKEFERELARVEAQAKRVGAAVEQSNRQQTRQRQPTAGGGGGLGGILGGDGSQLLGLAGISLSVAGIASLTQELATLRKQSLLATTAFSQLSGGSGQAATRLNAMKQAAGGTLTTMEALASANQITALGMASTAEGFGRITQAARAVTFVSPVIHDIGSAISELALASANLSFRRLDQLGLTVTEVKARMAELQAANAGMSDNTAFLEASVSSLIDKFGGLTDSTAAQAQGFDKLKISWAEFQRELAEGQVGEFADLALEGTADFINKVSTFIGVGSGETIQRALEAQVKDLLSNASLLESLPGADSIGLGKAARESAKDLEIAAKVQKQANDAIAAGAPGAANYAAQIEEITTSISRWGFASDEQIQQLNTLSSSLANATPTMSAFGAGIQDLADDGGQAAAQIEAINDARKALTEAVAGNAASAAGAIGQKGASEFLAKELERIDAELKRFEAQNLTGYDLQISVSLLTESLDRDLDELLAEQQRRMGEIFGSQISASLGEGIASLNSGAADASPALAAIRDELIQLEAQYITTGTATEEMAARHRELSATAEAVASSTGSFAALQGEAGAALLESNSHASGLATNMAILDGALAAGKISAEQHAGMMYSLAGALIAVAAQAGVTGDALAALQAIQDGIKLTGSPGNVAGQNAGDAIVAAQAAQEAARQRAEQRQAAERAAREQEQAAKRAGRELEAAAKRAGKELESSLRSVEGLFGLSKVSQKDLDFAAAGGDVNFADDFVRRFRDLVENGVLHEGAGVEDVKQALQNIGIQPAEDLKFLLGQLEEAWNNSSLFANKDNLALINAESVQQSLDLQAKMEEGRNNIMEFFGVTIDAATGAVSSASATNASGEELKTAVTDGQKKITEHLVSSTGAVVDAVTATSPTASVASGAVQITNVTIAPTALAGLFDGIKAPPVIIDQAITAEDFGQSAAGAIGKQFIAFAGLFYAIGKGPGADIENGLVDYWVSVAGKTNIADEIVKATGAQLIAFGGLFYAIGQKPAVDVESGFVAYWASVATKTNIVDGILAATATQFVAGTPTMLAQGGELANVILTGFNQEMIATQTKTDLADNLRLAFGTQVQATRESFTGQGIAIAGIIEQGFANYWTIGATGAQSGLAAPLLDQLTTQIVSPASLSRMEAMGGGIAGFIMLGMESFDFGGAGGSLINQIEASINSESSIGRLTGVGASVADALFNGFAARIPDADWVGIIVAAVIAQLSAGVKAE